jgi:crotonobetainyl-CoA:carnitine CoA-transferase CaiB-like acyl-CoA transferase
MRGRDGRKWSAGRTVSNGPLSGVRVLEFSQIVALPFAGCILSDLGADVIKVEPPTGDPHRTLGAAVTGNGKRFQSLNRGKRSLAVDLKDPRGLDVIYRLLPSIDVVTINFRGGVPERLRLDYETLKRYNPRLIYCEITGFGTRGPLKDRVGTQAVATAYSGLTVGEGKVDEEGGPLGITATSIADYAAGFSSVAGVLAALYHRERTGRGQRVSATLLRSSLAIQDTVVMREPVHDAHSRDLMLAEVEAIKARGGSYLEMLQARSERRPFFPGTRCYSGGFQARDGILVLGALTPAGRNGARNVLGITDDRYDDDPDFDRDDPKNLAEAAQRLERVKKLIRTRTVDEWVAEFEAAGVPVSPLNLPEQMSDDPQVEALGIMAELEHEVTGPQRVVGSVVELSETPASVQRAAPTLGRHTDEVLAEAGLSPDAIAELRASGVVFGKAPVSTAPGAD